MKLKIIVGVLVLLVVVNVAAVGTLLYVNLTRRPAGVPMVPGGPDGRFGREARGPRALGLDHEDRRELLHLLDEFREETRDLADRVDSLETEVVALLRLDPVPRARADSLLHEIALTRLEISRRATDKLIETKNVLSLRQQEVFYRAILGSRPERMGEGRRFKGRPQDRP